jgi:hypothetical protein
MDTLIYQTTPAVTFATNVFTRVPIILQFDDTPLVSVVPEVNLGFTTEIPIYHPDGTYLAKVRGTRIYPTTDGEKAGLVIRKLAQTTVCELAGRTAFEIHHQTGDAFKLHAELHAPNGFLVKSANTPPSIVAQDGQPLKVGRLVMSNNAIDGFDIGVLLKSDGSCRIGVKLPGPKRA